MFVVSSVHPFSTPVQFCPSSGVMLATLAFERSENSDLKLKTCAASYLLFPPCGCFKVSQCCGLVNLSLFNYFIDITLSIIIIIKRRIPRHLMCFYGYY